MTTWRTRKVRSVERSTEKATQDQRLTVSQQTKHRQIPRQSSSSKEDTRRNGLLLGELENSVNLGREGGGFHRSEGNE